MPLPFTNAYQLRLQSCVELAENIAAALRPLGLTLSSVLLIDDLFGHLDAISQQCPPSATRMGMWLYSLVVLNALQPEEAEIFLIAARTVAGPSGVARH